MMLLLDLMSCNFFKMGATARFGHSNKRTIVPIATVPRKLMHAPPLVFFCASRTRRSSSLLLKSFDIDVIIFKV